MNIYNIEKYIRFPWTIINQINSSFFKHFTKIQYLVSYIYIKVSTKQQRQIEILIQMMY